MAISFDESDPVKLMTLKDKDLPSEGAIVKEEPGLRTRNEPDLELTKPVVVSITAGLLRKKIL